MLNSYNFNINKNIKLIGYEMKLEKEIKDNINKLKKKFT